MPTTIGIGFGIGELKSYSMKTRRDFISKMALGTVAAGLSLPACNEDKAAANVPAEGQIPLAISTWPFGTRANEEAWKILSEGGKALDAVEQGVRVIEADPSNQSVGYGGLPDRDGHVTLDACIMDSTGNCGSVAALEHIKHPISVARRVMERTPHVILVGEGALDFALTEGFPKENLLTPEAKARWEKWVKTAEYKPRVNAELHDTIGMLAIDKDGNISGACTTSGMAFKMHGRVGDSPIIGAGLYVDNEVGGAAATGLGEEVLKSLSTFLVVELMRNGATPQQACEQALDRIIKRNGGKADFQVGLIAVNKAGVAGGAGIQAGFSYALYQNGENSVHKAKNLV